MTGILIAFAVVACALAIMVARVAWRANPYESDSEKRIMDIIRRIDDRK